MTDKETDAETPDTVLVVNDSIAARYTTSTMLRRAGYRVIEASSGAEALAAARLGTIAIVLDLHLPDIDGFEVCRRLREDEATASIKVLRTSSALSTVDKRIAGLRSGADGYLAASFESEELAATIQSLVRLRKAERSVRDRADALAEASRRKDEFLAMLAHELRNPLSAVRASIPLVTPAVHDGAAQRAMSIIERQVAQLSALVDDLLDVARITRGKTTLQTAHLDLRACLSNAVLAARGNKAICRSQVVVYAEPTEPLFVSGDANRLEQVFGNLLDNALKYSDPGTSVEVRAFRADAAGSPRVCVSFRDNGVGIDPSMLDRVFDTFEQGAVPLERSAGGLGLGLSVVKGLVRLHGGDVYARSEGEGRGSEFVVTLPEINMEQTLPPLCPVPAPEAKDEPSGLRVLVVEDNEDTLEAMEMLLQVWGHVPSTASDGIEAVRRATSEEFDVALLDVGLPGLDGFEVARRIRATASERAHLTLVALTGYGAPEHVQEAMRAGFDHHMLKPVEPDKLRALLGSLR